jgi:hypothetical protein
MDDERIWAFEERLWRGDADVYRASLDDQCLMVLPAPPFVMSGAQAIEAVASTPRWARVSFSQQQVARPQEGLIVIAYHARAEREGDVPYKAHCSSVYRRLGHEEWRVVQHQQTPPRATSG